MKTHTDIRRCFPLIVLLFITVPHGETAEGEVKRQGIFGPCQGWGAGCGTNYITSRDSPRREQSLRAPTVSDSVEEPSYIPDNSFLFTSGKCY
ncbi:hypothetical protein FSP39_008988 [Pinctada imbricata]|uniref:Secreted protein n=1 Tax=Pinctada imbricata TaxID=66713 RepID=A0AA88YLA7_PINIB|nr:hypothetical protein FSP39_008988 [Pinctada imbricata]